MIYKKMNEQEYKKYLEQTGLNKKDLERVQISKEVTPMAMKKKGKKKY